MPDEENQQPSTSNPWAVACSLMIIILILACFIAIFTGLVFLTYELCGVWLGIVGVGFLFALWGCAGAWASNYFYKIATR